MTDEINAYWHPDGSGIDAVFAERDRYLATLQQIAAAGPMFSPDDWRWKVAHDAVKGQGENPYDEIARLTALIADAVGKLRWSARRQPGIWGDLVNQWADGIERGELPVTTAPEAYAEYLEIPDTPEERAYRKGWNDAVTQTHGPFEVVSDADVAEIFGAPV